MIDRAVNVGALATLVFSSAPLHAQQAQDWANLQRYRQANDSLQHPRRTSNAWYSWATPSPTLGAVFPQMFPGKPYLGRGISGQTTPQMLVRFQQDVVALKPEVVVILAGTNDIAGNTGPSTLEMIEDNSVHDGDRERQRHPCRAGVRAAGFRLSLEAGTRARAEDRLAQCVDEGLLCAGRLRLLDYHSAMADERQGMRLD